MFEKKIDRGVELMDKVNPEWVCKINLDVFDISNGETCVLGQIYRAEYQEIERYQYGEIEVDPKENFANPYSLGLKRLKLKNGSKFGFHVGNGDRFWANLNQEWKQMIYQLKRERGCD